MSEAEYYRSLPTERLHRELRDQRAFAETCDKQGPWAEVAANDARQMVSLIEAELARRAS